MKKISYDYNVENSSIINVQFSLALIEIHDFNELSNDFQNIVSNYSNEFEIEYIILNIINGTNIIGHENCKKFINSYIDDFMLLRKYNCLNYFILEYLDDKKTFNFYDYLKEHRDEESIIKKNLNKLAKLGFDKIYYNNKVDFKKYYYCYNNIDNEISVLNNMRAVPTYLDSCVRYESNDSFYCIIYNNWYGCYCSIILNDLLFNSNDLPKSLLSFEEARDLINKLKYDVKIDHGIFCKTIDAMVCSNDFNESYFKLSNKLLSIKNENNKDEITKILEEYIALRDHLKKFSNDYSEQILKDNNISMDDIQYEVNEYKLRRYDDSLN